MRILVYGDSISEGFWDYKNGGWVNMLKLYLWKKYYYEKIIFNFGVSSYTSNNILNFFIPFFNGISKREKGKEKESLIIISIGINDCSINKKTLYPRINEEDFTKNIKKIIKLCDNEKLIKKVIFLTNINVDENVINNDSEGEFLFYNSNIEKYNKIIQLVCEKKGISFIDLYGSMDPSCLEDGLHPNTKGHKIIFEKVKVNIES